MSMRLSDAGNVKVPETIVEESERRMSFGQGLRAVNRRDSGLKLKVPKLPTDPPDAQDSDSGVDQHKIDEGLGESLDQQSVVSTDSTPPRRRVTPELILSGSSPNLSSTDRDSPRLTTVAPKNSNNNGKPGSNKLASTESIEPPAFNGSNVGQSTSPPAIQEEDTGDPFSRKPLGAAKKVSFLWSEIGKNLKDPKVETYVYDGSMKNPGELDGKNGKQT